MRHYSFFFFLSLFLGYGCLPLAASNEQGAVPHDPQLTHQIAALKAELAARDKERDLLKQENEQQKRANGQLAERAHNQEATDQAQKATRRKEEQSAQPSKQALRKILRKSIHIYHELINTQNKKIEVLDALAESTPIVCGTFALMFAAIGLFFFGLVFINKERGFKEEHIMAICMASFFLALAAGTYRLGSPESTQKACKKEEGIKADYQRALQEAESAYDNL